MTINLSLKAVLIVLCCVLAIACASLAYHALKKPVAVNAEVYTPAPEIRETVKIKRIEVPGPERIVTIEKEKVVEKLQLPDEIGKNPDKQVIATAKIPPHEGDTNAVAVMDTRTGEGSISVKQEDPPIFAFKNQKEIGGRFGYTTDESGVKQVVDAYGRWTVLRVWKIHLGLYGEVNSKPEGKTAVDVSYRW